MKRILWMFGALCACGAFGQSDLIGYRRFPELRSISGLPGGGFGVTFQGKISFDGVMAMSTPVGATIGSNQWAFSGSVTSKNGTPAFYNFRGQNNSRGTVQAMGGYTLPFGYFSGTFEVLSGYRDNIVNLQFSPKIAAKDYSVSFGVQNLSDHMAASGIGRAGDGSLSRSIYVAASYQARPKTYFTLGFGDNNRFRGLFGSVNLPIGDRYKFITEYDTFNFNSAIAAKGPVLKRFLGSKDVATTLSLGYIREKYLNYMVTFSL